MQNYFADLLAFFGISGAPQTFAELIPWLFAVLVAIGIVLATGIYMVLSNCFVKISDVCINIPAIIISIILVLSIISYRQLTKKKLSPILLMVISAVAGVVVYGI